MKKWLAIVTVLVLAVSFTLVPAAPAQALSTCTFTTSGTTMTLDADCTTDATILVPDGFTLDGDGHTITAVDPAGGHFLGAVVKNSGASATVIDLTIQASGLANVCDSGVNRLRAILFVSASGTIEKNTVLGVNQGDSGCQEGNAIEVRNAPFNGTHPDTKTVTIRKNTVANYQKTGIVANGDVSVVIEQNAVTGLGPVNFIAQNGIQLGWGATGTVRHNEISDNIYTPATWADGGVLIYAAGDGITIEHNKVDTSDVGIWLAGADSASVSHNKVENSTWDGIALDDQGGTVDGNAVTQNNTKDNDVGIGLYGANSNLIEKNDAKGNTSAGFFMGYGATGNTLSGNKARDNSGDGILVVADSNVIERNHSDKNDGIGIAVDGDGNTVERNHAKKNGVSDVQNTGSNTYTKNKCDSSSGPPVDCGASPTFDHEQADSIPAPQPSQ